jgi:hypothetical protein
MKRLFHYLSLLNIIDAFVTHYGLENGYITEMNLIMDTLYQTNSGLFIFAKLALSGFLYLFIFFNMVPSSRLVKFVTVIASGLYTVVFGLHCVWLLIHL